MKKLFLLPVLFGLAALSTTGLANEFTFAQAGVKFSTANEWAIVPPKEVDLLYAPVRGPAYLMANPQRSVGVSYDLKPFDISGLDLGVARKTFEQVLERRVPTLVWKTRQLLEHEQQSWLQLEFVSRAAGVDYYNILLITPAKGQMLVLNLHSTLGEFPRAEAQLRAVLKSIVLNVVVPPEVAKPATPKPHTSARKKE
jgi:hypothetical protein